jgi:hypothetical protein
VISIVIHPSVSPATGRTLRSLPVKAFVVPPLSRRQVPGQGLAQRTHAARPQPRRRGDDDQVLGMARSGRQLRRPVPGAALSLYPQLKTSNILLE